METDEFARVRDLIPEGCVPCGFVVALEVMDTEGKSGLIMQTNVVRKTEASGLCLWAANQLFHQ